MTRHGLIATTASIESDIARFLPLIPNWPAHFHTANCARDFVAEKAGLLRFEYTVFEGVEKGAYDGYVNYNTARHAFEAGFFTIKYPGYGWKEKPKTVGVIVKPAFPVAKTTKDFRSKEEEDEMKPVKPVHVTKRGTLSPFPFPPNPSSFTKTN